jgi:hypothetical protein
MEEWPTNILSFSGKLLIPGFSIYLMEVTIDGVHQENDPNKELLRWYYIGMTGDNYYPSARSAFHRISGHLELAGASTQNQLYKGIAGLVGDRHRKEGKYSEKSWEDVNITMTSYPIGGYEELYWLDRRADEKGFKFSQAHMKQISAKDKAGGYTYQLYRDYKALQVAVATFEKRMVRYAKGKLGHGHLFNGGSATEEAFDAGQYEGIAERICVRMKIEW